MRIVYNSFHGRFSDNPRAIWERLQGRRGLDHVWLADPAHAHALPDDVACVDINGPEAPGLLGSADLLIANSHTELEWDKPSGARYLQTWHGTPLKRVHHDVLWAPEGRLSRLDRDVARWDVLLSPNAVSTPRLRGAFRFEGPVLETGYPRNDLLLAADTAHYRAATRAALGLSDEQRAVLYAPTWRDGQVLGGDEPIALALDMASLTAALPGTVVLVRAHNLMTERLRLDAVPGVVDVSRHPDIRDLYLAADVLVTDYSSTMFDFAVTGKPMVFYCYDLDDFRDSIRGFYFDFLPLAPGPVVTTPEELAEELAALPATATDHAERYADFQRLFCSLEDGHATDRVLAALDLPRKAT